MINTDRYYFMSITGSEIIPSNTSVLDNAKNGIVTLIQFDSNVCLNLVAFVQNRSSQERTIVSKNQHLLTTLKDSEVDVHFAFPIYELCLDRNTFTIDREKYQSLANGVWEAIHLGIEDIYRADYTHKNIEAPKDKIFENIAPLSMFFKIFYASFLKIILISRSGISKDKAVDNMIVLVKWLDEKLDFNSSFVLQAAYAVFGGDTQARKLLGIDKSDYKKCAWGAAADAWLVFMSQVGTLGKLTAHQQNCIFVTADRGLFSVFTKNPPRAVLSINNKIPLCAHEVDCDYPHFNNASPKKIELLNNIMDEINVKRLPGASSRSPIDLGGLISELELQLQEKS